MRIDPGTCRDPDLLASEVRRLQSVIDSGETTLTDAERYAVMAGLRSLERTLWADPENLGGEYRDIQRDATTLRGLLERTANRDTTPPRNGTPAGCTDSGEK